MKMISIGIIVAMCAITLVGCINKDDVKKTLESVVDVKTIQVNGMEIFSDDDDFRDSEKWGKVVTLKCDAADFTEIEDDTQADIIYRQSDTYSVILHGNEKVIDKYYKVTCSNGKLNITNKISHNGRIPKIEAVISTPTLKGVTLNGTGDIDMPDEVSFDNDLTLITDGTGDIDIVRLTCQDLTVKMNGTGDVDIRHAKCGDKILIDNNGTGDVSGKYKATDIDITNNGTGDIDIKVNCENLKADASGTGEIELEGTANNFIRKTNGLSKIDSKDLRAENISR